MPTNKPFQILLIDDDEDDRDFFNLALSDVDTDVRCDMASGAKMAYSMLEHDNYFPDFIFLDLNMPGISGRSCLIHLKGNTKTAHIPVVMFSTSSEQHDIIETKALGAVHFMTKPADLTQLSADLNKFLSNNFK